MNLNLNKPCCHWDRLDHPTTHENGVLPRGVINETGYLLTFIIITQKSHVVYSII